MKHLVHKIHHPHLRKRAILELSGLIVLIIISSFQWEIIQEAIATISEVNALWFFLLLAIYWVMLPLTAISYKFITPKPKKLELGTTTLAHLAGAGPGRIIPGGIGNLSITAVHLKKTGLSIEKAIGVVVTNNMVGLIVNASLVISVLLIRPETLSILTDNISSRQIAIGLLFIIGLIVLVQWLLHAHRTKKEVNKTINQWKGIVKQFIKHPVKLCAVVSIALIIAIMHTLMLDFSAFALGIELGITDALIALSFGVAIGGILPTPGGIGGVEAGTTATLIVLGYSPAEATSIALLFRVATYWQPLIPGTFAYLYLRERKLL